MAKKLPVSLQMSKLEDRCYKFNQDEDCTLIDFRHIVDSDLSYSENLDNLKSEYPGFNWEKPATPKVKEYEEQVIDQLRVEADPYSYDIVKKYKIESLQRDSRRADRLSKKLDVCETRPTRSPSKLGACPVKTVRVKKHLRCKPRN